MSLPQATKDISANPSKSAVTAPSDQKALEADVDHKLKLYGVVQAFRAGRMPDNKQIDETLAWLNDPRNSPVDTKNLSADGNKLVEDFRAIIETARQMIAQKNHDEIFQSFISNTSGVEIKGRINTPNTPLSKDEAKAHGNQAVVHLRTLLQLLLTNAETRKLLSDLTIVSRDLFATGASKAAETLRPPPDQLANVDDVAPSSQWAENEQTDNLKDAAKGMTNEVKAAHSDLPNGTINGSANGSAVPAAPVPAPQIDATATAIAANSGTQPVETKEVVKTDGTVEEKKTVKGRIQDVSGKIPDKHKALAKENYHKGKTYLTEEYFPKERRDQFVYRLKKVVIECQSHPKYQEALEWFLNMMETYFGHAKSVAGAGGNEGKNFFQNDPVLQSSTTEFRTLLERFANGASMQPSFDATQAMYADARNDEALSGWWKKVDGFVRKALLEQGFILSPQFDTQSRQLREEGQTFFNGKYKGHKDNLVDTISAFFKSFGDDPLNVQFGNNWNTLTRDLLFGEDGKTLAYKPQLWKDIRSEIVPSLVNKIGYVPIPRVEYTDDKLDLVIENLTLQGRNLFPKYVQFLVPFFTAINERISIMEININNHIKVSPYSIVKDAQNHTLTLTLSQIQADMRDVAFYFKKKSGFPKLKDQGLADVFLGGQGITAVVQLHSQGLDGTGSEMRGRVFKVKDVKVKVDALKFSIRDSKHNLLYKTLRPLATGLIKKQISKALADGIRTGLEALDEQLVQVRDKLSNDNEDPEFSRRKALKEHFGSKKSDAADAKAAAQAKAARRHSQFKIVPKGSSMILPDVGYEKGWIKRQAERDEKVGEGEGWKSSAFSIVPTSNAPTTNGTAPAIKV